MTLFLLSATVLAFPLSDSLIGGLVFRGVSPPSIGFHNGRGSLAGFMFHPVSTEPGDEDKRAILREVRRRQFQHRLDRITCQSTRLLLIGEWHWGWTVSVVSSSVGVVLYSKDPLETDG